MGIRGRTSSPPAAIRSVPWGAGRRPGSGKATGADRREVGEDRPAGAAGGAEAPGSSQRTPCSSSSGSRPQTWQSMFHTASRCRRGSTCPNNGRPPRVPAQRNHSTPRPSRSPAAHHGMPGARPRRLGHDSGSARPPGADVGEADHRRPRFPGDEMVPWPGPCHREPPRACQETAWLLAMTALLSVLAVTACLPDPTAPGGDESRYSVTGLRAP